MLVLHHARVGPAGIRVVGTGVLATLTEIVVLQTIVASVALVHNSSLVVCVWSAWRMLTLNAVVVDMVVVLLVQR
jgi:hypothetical protein